jgi:two-component system cell cycle sensor histidine kinase/response regulator CckA
MPQSGADGRDTSRHAALVDFASDWMWEIDARGVFTYSNPAVTAILGYAPEEVVGRMPFDFMPPDEARRVRAEFDGLVADRSPLRQLRNTNIHKDGRPVTLETSGRPFFRPDGTFAGYRGIDRDVSASVRAEEGLRQGESRFRAIFGNSPVGMVVIGENTVITDANPAFCSMVGVPCESLVGRTMMDLTHPDGVAAAVTNAQKSSGARGERSMRFESRLVHADATPLWTSQVGAVIRDARGNPVCGLAIVEDISERRRAEEHLREEAAFRRAIIEKAADGLCVCHAIESFPNVAFTVWNGRMCEITGYTMDEINARGWYQSLYPDPDVQKRAMARMARMREGDDIVGEEWEIVRKDGAKRIVTISTSVIRSAGDQAHVLALIHDLTERRRADEERRELEAQVQHTQKLESLGVLAGGIAHDFNNLLMSMLGNADLALLDLPVASPARDRISDIESTARRAADLCRQMLAYSGKGRFVIELLDLAKVITEISRMLEVSISKRAVLRLNFADNLPMVRADATQVRQVIMNLITNASEALGEKNGVISISTGAMDCDRAYLRETFLDEGLAEGRYVYLEVADTGCGMDEETRKKIFEPFFTTKFTGRGLGMAAVLGIVRGHRGAIKVYSEPKRGTTVKVLLPAAPAAADVAEPRPASVAQRRFSGTVLLADDEESVRTIARLMLERLGFDVVTAIDGRETLDVFRAHRDRIVCVLLDLTMPNLDGEETFRELRRIDRQLRVVLSSGYNEQDVVQRFVGRGLTGFIQKPYQLETLRTVLHAVLNPERAPG